MRCLLLLASLVLILCLDVICHGEELPCPVRIPTPMLTTDECDCESCCCAQVCQCKGLSYDAALTKALQEGKPIAVFVNTKVMRVEGVIVCHTNFYPELRMGVVVGVPVDPCNPAKGMREVACVYGGATPKKILAFIRDYQKQTKLFQIYEAIRKNGVPIG